SLRIGVANSVGVGGRTAARAAAGASGVTCGRKVGRKDLGFVGGANELADPDLVGRRVFRVHTQRAQIERGGEIEGVVDRGIFEVRRHYGERRPAEQAPRRVRVARILLEDGTRGKVAAGRLVVVGSDGELP